MDPCLGDCYTFPTFVLHHCLYQLLHILNVSNQAVRRDLVYRSDTYNISPIFTDLCVCFQIDIFTKFLKFFHKDDSQDSLNGKANSFCNICNKWKSKSTPTECLVGRLSEWTIHVYMNVLFVSIWRIRVCWFRWSSNGQCPNTLVRASIWTIPLG